MSSNQVLDDRDLNSLMVTLPSTIERLPGVSLVIPAYNEESRIRPALEQYSRTLSKLGTSFEIIVVVDGNDGTARIAQEYASRGVRTCVEPRRLGKGGAILRGFRLASFPLVGYVDADNSLDPSDLERLIRTAERYGCAIGSRRIPGSKWTRNRTWGHNIASLGYNTLVRGILGVPVKDTQCGAKFYTREVLHSVLPKVTITNMTVDTAVLFHLRRQGTKIAEVPVNWSDADGSRFTLGSEVFVMFITLVGIRWMNLGKRSRTPGKLALILARRYASV